MTAAMKVNGMKLSWLEVHKYYLSFGIRLGECVGVKRTSTHYIRQALRTVALNAEKVGGKRLN